MSRQTLIEAGFIHVKDGPEEGLIEMGTGWHLGRDRGLRDPLAQQQYRWRTDKLEVKLQFVRMNPVWNLEWLKHCVLIFKDLYAHIWMKVVAAADPDVEDITDVLNAAWKFGLQFYLYMPESKVRLFSGGPIAPVDQLALPRMFDIGHTENFMNKISPEFYTASSVSEGEGLILVGYIAGVRAEPDKYLFPMQAMLDEFSDDFHGMVGEGACQIIGNVLAHAENNPSWLTESGWKSYLRSNNWGKHKPKHMPSKDDFQEIGDKLVRSFPLNWQYINVGEIRVPERFDS
ncbi:hypothetical protein C8R45DRAFT_1098731 [Mycena sanguinolenta]|nr:hypothetical protein C8R45DRAFT_1098731 [Mycena sanguinolenta]